LQFDIVEALDPTRSGVAKNGFVRSNPVECTQRRLLSKILLRRARAYELLGNLEASAADLRVVRKTEPENREAKQRLADLELAMAPQPEQVPAVASSAPALTSSSGGPGDQAGGSKVTGQDKPTKIGQEASSVAVPSGPENRTAGQKSRDTATDIADDDEEEVFDHAATATLLQSAADYMRKNDYQGALQIYNYVRRRCKVWESPVVELKVLSNTSLCLQRLRGRLPELIRSCTEALQRIKEVRVEAPESCPEDMLLNMECAVLSRRGNAYSQEQKTEESNRDAARVRELLGKS